MVMRHHDNDNIKQDSPLRLAVAAALAFPDGSMSTAGLRRESKRGRLTTMRIAGKDYTTLAYIEEMKERCLVKANQQGSGSAPQIENEPPCGSSSTKGNNIALDAARRIVQELRQSSKNSSSGATSTKTGESNAMRRRSK